MKNCIILILTKFLSENVYLYVRAVKVLSKKTLQRHKGEILITDLNSLDANERLSKKRFALQFQ